MTPIERKALELVAEYCEQRDAELVDQWKASDNPQDRECLHAQTLAVIDLKDHVNGRLADADG